MAPISLFNQTENVTNLILPIPALLHKADHKGFNFEFHIKVINSRVMTLNDMPNIFPLSQFIKKTELVTKKHCCS